MSGPASPWKPNRLGVTRAQTIELINDALPYMGEYPTLAALITAHPEARPGDYAVINDPGDVRAKLYIWDPETETWTRAGDLPVESTGVFYGGQVTINGDPTKFDVAMGAAVFLDYSDPTSPKQRLVVFGPYTGLTTPFLNTEPATYLAIDNTGAPAYFDSPLTNAQRRQYAQSQILVHTNLTTINVVNENAATVRSGISQLHDFMVAVSPINQTGNVYTPNGANLKLNRSLGEIFKLGCNFFTNPDDPHHRETPAEVQVSFRYRNQNGETGGNVTDVDPNTYDLAGVTTAVPNNRWTAQQISIFQSGLTRIQRGQEVFNSLTDALTAIANKTTNFVKEDNIRENGIFRYWLVVKQGTTQLDDPTKAVFIEAPGIGGSHGGFPTVRDHFRGVYATFAALVAANPASEPGDYAQVNETGTEEVTTYWWDEEAASWVEHLWEKKTQALGSVAGVVTIDVGNQIQEYQLQVTEDITSWVWQGLPAAGKFRDIDVLVRQDLVTPRPVASPATPGFTAGGAWTVSGVAGERERLGLRVYSDGTVHLNPSGVLS